MTDAPRSHPVLSHVRSNTGPRLALVCALILLIMALTMSLPEGKVSGSFVTIAAGLAFIASVWASRVTSRVLRIVVAVVIVGVTASVVSLLVGDDTGSTANAIVSTIFVAGMPVAILVGLRDERTVNMQTVFGALALYLLIGIFFTLLITVVTHISSTPYFAQGTDGSMSQRVYFSYITAATVGYGDLTPATNLGRALSVFEALFGSLFLITVVSVVVSRIGGRRPSDEIKRPMREAIREEKTSSSSLLLLGRLSLGPYFWSRVVRSVPIRPWAAALPLFPPPAPRRT